MRRLQAALFLMLIGLGMAGGLSGCIIEEDRGGGGEHHRQHHDD